MNRLRTRLRAGGGGSGGPAFDPASIFTGGAKGIWLDPSDTATGYQDSAGTTLITASGQFVGKRLDKSGNGNHVLQATGSAQPEWDVLSGISSDYTDGSNDGYSTATFAAGTFGSAMDLFITLNRASTSQMAICSQAPSDATKYIGGIVSGNATVAAGQVGSAWTCFVNGVQVGGTANTTEGQLHTAIGSGSYKVLTFRDLNLSAWTQFTLGLYSAFMLNADVAQLVLCPSQTSDIRSKLLTYCGAKGGLSL